MTRAAMIMLLLAAPLLAQEGPTFLERAEKTAKAVADAHVNLAKWAVKRKMNVDARRLLAQALELSPEHEGAMKELGYRQKKVNGIEQWVLDERFVLPDVDGEYSPDQRETFTQEQEKLNREAAAEYVKLARQAEKMELPTHARVAYEQAVKFDPGNEDALTGAGWVRDELDEWISPAEKRERDENAAALSGAPQAEPLDDLPDWTARAFKKQPAMGVKSGTITVIGSDANLAGAAKFAYASLSLCVTLLGGRAEAVRVVVAADAREHEDYCATRHPGIPGLVESPWVLGDSEVEVQLDAKDDRLGLERVVYAVATFEVRRRCGESTHPFFEVGFASNLTRRLLGRVTTAEFSGEAEGPSEAGRWKRTLRMMVAAGNSPTLDKLVVARDPDEHQVILAHYFVRYLCAERRAALPDFCLAFKSAEHVEDALESAFEQDSAGLHKLFVDWFERN